MNRIFFAIRLLAFVGIGLALFLLWERYFHPAFQPCNINSHINCDAIISGPVSTVLGVPTSLIGLLGYIGILTAAIFEKKKWIVGFATGGLLFCLWIAFRELIQLHVVCPVCILCQIDMITVFILSVWLLTKSSKTPS
ncbi:MAG TPA: vitamin K epoxide reductase family protein [Patescibacteria group bacterium]|nr:vitamin K epoxide reductase family protein [Patescibacteria group bacterium]